MKTKLIVLSAATALVVTAAPAFADHNSKDGEGTANMPNDIHNTRIETKEANDNEAFRDFVKYGEGSKVPNRFESDDTTAPQAREKQGNANSSQNQQQSGIGEQKMVREKKMEQIRDPAAGAQGQQQAGTAEQAMVREKKMDQVREHAPVDKASERSVRSRSNRTSMNTNRTSTQRSTGRRGGGGGRGGR